MTRFATLLLLLFAAPALAQTPGTCDLGTAERDLDIGSVQARLFNTGSLFYGNDTTNGLGYIVPIQRGTAPLFAAGIWVGGFVGDDLRVAGARYDRFEFWPGPLNEGGTLPNSTDCSAYDRIWLVSADDVARYEATGEAPADLAAWPVGLGADAVDAGGNPVIPTSREQVVDLEAGERPVVFGSQTAFWVMNDVGNEHLKTWTDPIGLEVQVTAFAVASGDENLDQATFYRYRLVNRNTQAFEDARFGFFQDPDLGDAADDYLGVDTTRSLAFTYNEAGMDAFYGIPPAFGVGFLDGLHAFSFFYGSGFPLDDPNGGAQMYNRLRGLWNDGTPITEGGNGFQTDGQILRVTYPGDPVTRAFWSEENPEGDGVPNPSGDRRSISASPAFSLAPGERHDIHLALVFGQGTDRLDSVTELRAASDFVQAAYDDGSLFDTVLPDPPITLAAPSLLSPADGEEFFDQTPLLTWSTVAGAATYRVEIGTDPGLSNRRVSYTEAATLTPSLGYLPDNEVAVISWRVRAEDGDGGVSPFSETRAFIYYRYLADGFGSGVGIVEVATPSGDPCPDPDDPGCDRYGGNTVWLDPSTTGDYVVTNSDNDLDDLLRDADTIQGDDFEVRFTDACATAGACLGVYSAAAPGGTDLITSVPFELWNIGAEDGTGDELRMIPILRAPSGGEPISAWADAFTAEQAVIVGSDTLTLPITHRVIGMMPDRPNGYTLFEEAANSFGGPGATYDSEADGDTQDDPDCHEISQGYYIDFCWRNGGNRFVAPIGGLDGVQFADLAGDGTTPPVGTVIRFDANERLLTDTEDEGPGQPTSFALGAAYPNPFRSSATVPFGLGAPGRVRLSVVDVLGREVAVLEDGERAAGAHQVTVDGSRLASGLYLVVLEAEGRRQATKVLLLR